MKTAQFVETLANLSFEDAFNPYRDACEYFDREDAPAIRRTNLTLVLDAAIESKVDTIWIARDLGYRGGRRTGLALTDDAHLNDHSLLYGELPLARATKGPVVSERTATVIWQTLRRIQRPVFLWNVFPLHPHEAGDSQSNRCHNRAERNACRPLLVGLLEMLVPRVVVAVGRDAQFALADMGINAIQVRHPSYGGQSGFISGMERLYELPMPSQAPQQLAML